jgi:hypothetical protein
MTMLNNQMVHLDLPWVPGWSHQLQLRDGENDIVAAAWAKAGRSNGEFTKNYGD